MAGNRVDQLEETVQELEATVSGLTDELVETKERLRALEEEVEPDLETDIIEGQVTRGEADDEEVKEAVQETAADEAKGDEPHDEDNADPEESDDIIVA